MKRYVQRLLIFFIGVPVVIALVFFLPYRNHLIMNLFIVFFCALGAIELKIMLEKKQLPISAVEAVILGSLAPLLVMLVVCFNVNFLIIPVFLCAAVFWIFISSIFLQSPKLDDYINRITAGFAMLIYPGGFLALICAMGSWNSILILVFLLIPIMGDSTAWAAGMLFGKNNQGVVKVSPNKSIAGFIGGIFASVLIGVVAAWAFPDFFIPRFSTVWLSAAILGLITGIAAILGDLCESAIKRSADVKDSGAIMPGRGGVLDSVDSIAFAAPVFYCIWMFLFN